jgi:flavin-dependent thymidylate synthase
MTVQLIDFTGAATADPARYAANLLIYTKNTRLQQGADTQEMIMAWDDAKVAQELDYISKTIRSSWEFIDYVFQVTRVTRAYTHQQVRTRTGSYAQQSQRSVDMSDGIDVIMPETVLAAGKSHRWERVVTSIADLYRELVEDGVPTEDARGILPTNQVTNIIVKFDLRTVADLCAKRDNPRAQGEYTSVVKEMVTEVLRVHPWAQPFLYPERLKTPALDKLLREALGGATPASKPHINDALKELDALKQVWG